MIQSTIARLLLAPISLLYGLGVSLRNFMYQRGLLKGVSFSIPIISVGNLSVGGAGKTPHIEYLIRLLDPYINVSTISRGYSRKTKGFRFVQATDNAETVGDEPLQFKRKFPHIPITVAESRTFAIPEIIKSHPKMQTILLDDAFQHRSIKAGMNILLTEFSEPFTNDYLLPSGRLREWRSGYKRADIIIVTKCPDEISVEEKKALTNAIQPQAYQQIFFSYYQYFRPYYLFNPRYVAPLQEDWDVILICAIARSDYLVDYLTEQVNSVYTLSYEDHRYFSKNDIANLKRTYDNLPTKKKIIITTEKDAMRIELHREFLVQHKLPIFVLPVQVAFHFNEGEQFDNQIKDFLLDFKV